MNTVSPIIIPITLSPSPIKTLLDTSTERESSTIGKSVSNSKIGILIIGDGRISGEEEGKKKNEEGKREKDNETSNSIKTKVKRRYNYSFMFRWPSLLLFL